MTRRRNRPSGEEALEAAFRAVDHTPLLDALGVTLDDELLRLALTHRSFANENGNLPNNERLEFLGDAVLGLSVATQLYSQYSSRPESDISKMRASIVSRYGLAEVAREINLGEHILLGRGELVTDGRGKDSILSDTTEALLGAIYLQYDFDTARDVVLRLFQGQIDAASASNIHRDWKTNLQERVAELKYPMPVYEATSTGPEHDLIFSASVTVNGIELGTGAGPSKKAAEQASARQAFLTLRENPRAGTARG